MLRSARIRLSSHLSLPYKETKHIAKFMTSHSWVPLPLTYPGLINNRDNVT